MRIRVLLKFFAWMLSISALVALTMGIGLGLYASTLLGELPTVEQLRKVPLNIPLRIYSADGELIAEYGSERRTQLSLDDAPPLLIDAILATEDDRFYHHTGVDFPGLARAAYQNVISRSKSQGASTITMQVARNFFLNPEKTYTRKLKEILLAFNMERALTKDEILELYINKIFLGHRAYGFAAAAQVYYGAELDNLSVPELAMLAGLPKAPSRDNPISNPARAKERRAYVLKRLHELGRIDEFSYRAAAEAPLTARRRVTDVGFNAPYVAEMARQLVFEKFGDGVYEKGLNVTVSVDSRHQGAAQAALRKGLLDYDLRHGFRGPLNRVDLSTLPGENRAKELLAVLDEYPSSREITPAVILDVGEKEATAFTAEGDSVTLGWAGIKWARKYIAADHQGPEIAAATEVLAAGDVVYVRPDDDGEWMLTQIPRVSGALVSLDPQTGAILALTGGFDYFLSKFNRATQAERQPGSNIKPFIYSAALENGFTPSSLVSAAPIVVEDDLEGIWRPQNYSKKFFGPTPLRKALSLSLNLVSVRLLRAVGIDKTIAHLEKFGFDPERLPRSLSLALGSTNVTPLELASYFSVFANGGKRITPYLIEKIEDRDGNPIDILPADCPECEAAPGAVEPDAVAAVPEPDVAPELGQPLGLDEPPPEPAVTPPGAETDDATAGNEADAGGISPRNAFLVQDMLKQVILTGTGKKAQVLKRSDLAGKTGTTNDFRDAWFSGFTPDVMTTVYVGYDEPAYLGRREFGSAAALPVWIDFMQEALVGIPEREQEIPENITTRFVNRDTGEITTPDDADGYTEYYVSGTEPDNAGDTSGRAVGAQGDGSSVTESLF